MIKIESKESDKEVIEYKEFGVVVDVRAGKVYLKGYGDMTAHYLRVAAAEDSKEAFKKALRKAVEHVYESLLTEGDQG